MASLLLPGIQPVALFIKGAQKPQRSFWIWPQLGLHLLLHILRRVNAWGEDPGAQVSW